MFFLTALVASSRRQVSVPALTGGRTRSIYLVSGLPGCQAGLVCLPVSSCLDIDLYCHPSISLAASGPNSNLSLPILCRLAWTLSVPACIPSPLSLPLVDCFQSSSPTQWHFGTQPGLSSRLHLQPLTHDTGLVLGHVQCRLVFSDDKPSPAALVAAAATAAAVPLAPGETGKSLLYTHQALLAHCRQARQFRPWWRSGLARAGSASTSRCANRPGDLPCPIDRRTQSLIVLSAARRPPEAVDWR